MVIKLILYIRVDHDLERIFLSGRIAQKRGLFKVAAIGFICANHDFREAIK